MGSFSANEGLPLILRLIHFNSMIIAELSYYKHKQI